MLLTERTFTWRIAVLPFEEEALNTWLDEALAENRIALMPNGGLHLQFSPTDGDKIIALWCECR